MWNAEWKSEDWWHGKGFCFVDQYSAFQIPHSPFVPWQPA